MASQTSLSSDLLKQAKPQLSAPNRLFQQLKTMTQSKFSSNTSLPQSNNLPKLNVPMSGNQLKTPNIFNRQAAELMKNKNKNKPRLSGQMNPNLTAKGQQRITSSYHAIYMAMLTWINDFKNLRDEESKNGTDYDSFILYIPKPNTDFEDPECTQVLELKVTSGLGCITKQIPSPAQLANQFATLIINMDIFDHLHQASLERCPWTNYKIGKPSGKILAALGTGLSRAGKYSIFSSMEALENFLQNTANPLSQQLSSGINKLLHDEKNPITNDSKTRHVSGHSFIVLKKLSDLPNIRPTMSTQIGSYFNFIGQFPSILLENDWAKGAYNITHFYFDNEKPGEIKTSEEFPIDIDDDNVPCDDDDYGNIDEDKVIRGENKYLLENAKGLKELGSQIIKLIKDGVDTTEYVDRYAYIITRLILFTDDYMAIDSEVCEKALEYIKKLYSYKEFGPGIDTSSETEYRNILASRIVPFFTLVIKKEKELKLNKDGKEKEEGSESKTENEVTKITEQTLGDQESVIIQSEGSNVERVNVENEVKEELKPASNLLISDQVQMLIQKEIMKVRDDFESKIVIKDVEINNLTKQIVDLQEGMSKMKDNYEAIITGLKGQISQSTQMISSLEDQKSVLKKEIADLNQTITSHQCPISLQQFQDKEKELDKIINEYKILEDGLALKDTIITTLSNERDSLRQSISHLKANPEVISQDELLLQEFSLKYPSYNKSSVIVNQAEIRTGIGELASGFLRTNDILNRWCLSFIPILELNSITIIPESAAEGLDVELEVLGLLIGLFSQRNVIYAMNNGSPYVIIMESSL